MANSNTGSPEGGHNSQHHHPVIGAIAAIAVGAVASTSIIYKSSRAQSYLGLEVKPKTTGAAVAAQTVNPRTTVPTTRETTTTVAANHAPVIVLDPGHSGADRSIIDKQTGLIDHDYPTVPEITEVFTITKDLQAKLTAAGYIVVLTKQKVDDYVSLRDRANVAIDNHAALAVSIHDDHTQPFSSFKQIYPQEVGAYRSTPPPANQKISFTNAAVAAQSQKDAQIMQQARQKAEGGSVVIKLNSFDNRTGLSPGNTPLVQLFDEDTPWIYCEQGANGITPAQLQAYETGLLNGIEAAVPITG